MIELSGVSLSFDGKLVLKNIDVRVRRGEVLVILGPSGAGKSSILKVMLGLWRPDSGSVRVNGVEISHLPEREIMRIRRQVGIVFQGNALFDSMTVEENVAYFLAENRRMKSNEIRERVCTALDFVNLSGAGNLYPDQLSGGMKKR